MAIEQVSLSASILGLLSFISLILCAYLCIAFWDYIRNVFRKIHWKQKDTKLQVNWLYGDRRALIPGQFTSRHIQPVSLQDDDADENVEDIDCKDNNETKRSGALLDVMEHYSLGRIVFILRYIPDREELMVRLLEMEGLPISQEIYSADSAYVDVQLKYIGPVENEDKCSQPPKLDICLQQVYYFIISRDQLFFYSLAFQINTFDQSYRRTISGEVEVNLIDGLGRNIFTGNEIVLVREIIPISQKNSHEDKQEDNLRPQSPADSHLSWDYAPTESGTILSSDSGDLLPEDIPWHRPHRTISDDDLEEELGLTTMSQSVMSVPSSFHFSLQHGSILSRRDSDAKTLPGFSLIKRSISENIITKYSNIYPPPKDFYRIVPLTPFTAVIRSPEQGSTRRGLPGLFRFDETRDDARRMRGDSGLGRSFSWPCLNQIREDRSSVCSEESSHSDLGIRHRFLRSSPR